MLIAGSDTEHLDSLDRILRSKGVGLVTSATTGKEAVAKWKSAERIVDCVISEFQMPEGNGLQVLHAVRTGQVSGVRLDACFIVVASNVDPDILSICARLDINGLLVKSVTEERLFSAIAKGRKRVPRIDISRYQRVIVPWLLASKCHLLNMQDASLNLLCMGRANKCLCRSLS